MRVGVLVGHSLTYSLTHNSYRWLAAVLLVLFTLLFERFTKWNAALTVLQLVVLMLPGLRRVPRAAHALLLIIAPFVIRADVSALRSVSGAARTISFVCVCAIGE